MSGTTTTRTARTRSRLQAAALRLFSEQGYDATTVEQIAREAGVSHMTFFRHFPTKDAVVLEDGFDPAIAAAVAAAPSRLPPLARVCAGLRAALTHVDLPAQEEVRLRVRIAAEHPVLRAGTYAATETTQEAIVEVLVAGGASPFEARVASAAALAALTAALLEWCLGDTVEPMSSRLGAALGVLDGTAGR
ncbi:TetR/AcrR family transcriptional regulator [Ornithinimicrobium avium]|uniref:TetR family transcriptional regulator n=1 Tax=Ornithinimicrobium avium TaxID=2283195 RepID=A0A345NKD2_9MICO|nr:TetR/AcrR family transcriptional regulator [Ornithinimicrobium avium]AXH95490.1 TetR family transcriptional regulator [Ornithinimicrobium avium]